MQEKNNIGLSLSENPSPLPRKVSVAMAYVPYQNLDETYKPEDALMYGTLFPELNKRFLAANDWRKR